MDDVQVSSADSVLGQLQRGRGAGFLAALSLPRTEARTALQECITHDPRWDHQVEARAGYYAELALDLELDVEWLARWLTDHWGADNSSDDDATWLAAPVLTNMAVLGDTRAAGALLSLVRDTPLDRIAEAVQQLIGEDGAALSPELSAVLKSRLSSDELERLMYDLRWLGWNGPPPSWISDDPHLLGMFQKSQATDRARRTAHHPSRTLADVLTESGPAKDLVKFNSADDLQLLRSAALNGQPLVRRKALWALATRGDPSAPAAVEKAIREPTLQLKAAGRHAVHELHGPEALSAARRWIRLGAADDLAYAAVEVLGKTGSAEDIPIIRTLADSYTAKGYMYAMCTAVEALGRLRDRESIPWFRQLFAETEYSYLRKRCAAALADVDDTFSATLARECLWDCEPETRLAGVGLVPLTDQQVVVRLFRLATSPIEDGRVKQAAEVRDHLGQNRPRLVKWCTSERRHPFD